MTKRVRLLVEGRVQGVGYRYHTVAKAAASGVTGWVRNRSDGRVEVEAEGPEEAVDALAAWCERGPAFADVAKVVVVSSEEIDIPAHQRFSVRS